jgi:predicted nucleic acid-binding Zn ribbon protein
MVRFPLMLALKHAMPRAVAELMRSAPLSPGKVDFAWRMAVGPSVQRATAVRLEQGVLIVETASAQWSAEVRRSTSVILARLQTFLGDDTVTRVEVRPLSQGMSRA